ncbi:PARP-domain-containing protein [Xylariaceae sp. FL1019]|nr:PARP-domain-containing protein [Xylariaceae sp. FL1019]
MPATRKKQAATPVASSTLPLAGLTIAISGTIPGRTQASIERDYIAPLGGSLSKTVSATTTHLVTTRTDFDKPSAKVASARASSIPIVSFEWLEQCLAENQCVSDEDFDFSDPQPKRRKRDVSQVPLDNESKSQSSKAVNADDSKLQEQAREREAKVAEGQIAKSFDVKIPVDEGSERQLMNYEVYINDDGVIYDASLNQTNASNNNNKFYRIQVLRSVTGDYRTWTRWGRVGEYGTSKTIGDGSLADALKQFDAKFKNKSGLSWANRNDPPKPKHYAFVEKSYEPDSDSDDDNDANTQKPTGGIKKEEEPESKLPKSTQDLIRLIFNQTYFNAAMSDLNYDAAKLPLGKLSKNTISRGFQALKDLSVLIDYPNQAPALYQTSWAQATEDLSNLYFTLIPHAFGRVRPPIIRSNDLLKREIELLESLSDMKDAALLMKSEKQKAELNEIDRQFQGLGLNEMTPLDQKSDEFSQLKDYLMDTRGATHNANYQIQQIFRIERDGEFGQFDKAHKKPKDRRLLWHGSRCTNFGGILSQGLRIAPPEAPVSGYMFGKGIYLADMSSKSANYCCPYISNGHALLLLCEAELGSMQELIGADYDAGEKAKAKGNLSTWGKGLVGPSQWKDASCVHPSLKGVQMPKTDTAKPGQTNVNGAYLQYNEYICYDISQVRLRYLLRVRM